MEENCDFSVKHHWMSQILDTGLLNALKGAVLYIGYSEFYNEDALHGSFCWHNLIWLELEVSNLYNKAPVVAPGPGWMEHRVTKLNRSG